MIQHFDAFFNCNEMKHYAYDTEAGRVILANVCDIIKRCSSLSDGPLTLKEYFETPTRVRPEDLLHHFEKVIKKANPDHVVAKKKHRYEVRKCPEVPADQSDQRASDAEFYGRASKQTNFFNKMMVLGAECDPTCSNPGMAQHISQQIAAKDLDSVMPLLARQIIRLIC
jgi:hypothetical protein